MSADRSALPSRPRGKIDPALVVAILVGCVAGGFVVRYAAKTIPNRAVGGLASEIAGDVPVEETPVHTLEAVGDVRSVGFGSDSETIFIGDREGLTLRDATSGKILRTFDTDGNGVRAISVSPGGKTIAVALSFSGEVRYFDSGTDKPLLTFPNVSDKEQQSVAFAPDGNTVVSGGFDKAVRIWRAGETRSAEDLPGAVFDTTKNTGNSAGLLSSTIKVGDSVSEIAFAPDGKHIAVVTGPKVTIYELANQVAGQTFFADKEAITAIAYSPDGKELLTGTQSGELTRFDVATGRKKSTLESSRSARFTTSRSRNGSEGITAIRFRPDGTTAYVSGKTGVLVGYSMKTGKATKVYAENSDAAALSLALSNDGKRAIVGYKDGTVRIWNLEK